MQPLHGRMDVTWVSLKQQNRWLTRGRMEDRSAVDMDAVCESVLLVGLHLNEFYFYRRWRTTPRVQLFWSRLAGLMWWRAAWLLCCSPPAPWASQSERIIQIIGRPDSNGLKQAGCSRDRDLASLPGMFETLFESVSILLQPLSFSGTSLVLDGTRTEEGSRTSSLLLLLYASLLISMQTVCHQEGAADTQRAAGWVTSTLWNHKHWIWFMLNVSNISRPSTSSDRHIFWVL